MPNNPTELVKSLLKPGVRRSASCKDVRYRDIHRFGSYLYPVDYITLSRNVEPITFPPLAIKVSSSTGIAVRV